MYSFDQVLTHHIKILLGKFSVKVCREVIFNRTVGNKRLPEISFANSVRVVNFAISKNLIVKNTAVSLCYVHKFKCISPHEKAQSD